MKRNRFSKKRGIHMEQENTPVNEEAMSETADEIEQVQEETPAQDPMAEMQTLLTEAKAKADEYLAIAQRTQADFENYRRRNAAAQAEALDKGQRNVAGDMLPVLDNLERALDASASADVDSLRNGVELVLRQMKDVYSRYELEEINRLGEKFDPNLENAVMQGSPEDGEPGTVCMVLQKGYKMGKNVLRYAMVKVVPD